MSHRVSRATPSVIIEVITGPSKGRRLEFALKTSLVIGRGEDAGLQLPYESEIADRHCRLEIDPPVCFIRDLGSGTGTWVNQQKALHQELRNDDLIRVGDTRLRVRMNPPKTSTRPQERVGEKGVGRFGSTVISPVCGEVNQASRNLPEEPLKPCIPGYEVLGILGKGAMGVVYRGCRKSDDRSVAIKLIVPETKPKPESLQLFVREASIVSQLNHPNLVRFLEFGMTSGQLFLVMEYIPHVPIQELIRGRSLEQRTRLSCGIVCQILKGLSHAHRKSLVHRDVKPSNILVMLDEKRLIAKLTDFGLAKNYQHAGFSEITQDGQLRGTVAFMPPEQILDSRFAKPTSDIYAAGVTLYQYLCGELPFEMTSLREGLKRTLNNELIPLSDRRPDLPEELVAVVHRSMAMLPQDRFESAEEMLQALVPFTQSFTRGS